MHGSLGGMYAGSGFRLVGAGAYRAAAGATFPLHRHQTWEVAYYRHGLVACPVGSHLYEANPGVVVLTPPHTYHAAIARTAYADYYLGIDAPADHPWPAICFDAAERTIQQVCRALVREWGGQGPEREALITLLLAQLDILLRRAALQGDRSATEAILDQLLGCADDRFAEGLTVAGIAREVGVAPQTLRAHFAARRPYSPHAYLQRMRLDHAIALLRGSTLTLEAVAGTCGYCSASHLSRHVKHATGVRPGAMRAGTHPPLSTGTASHG